MISSHRAGGTGDKRMADKPGNRWLFFRSPAGCRSTGAGGCGSTSSPAPRSRPTRCRFRWPTRVAGLPPQTGLYCYLVAGLGYAIFGSSRHIAVGPTSAIALLLGVTLAPLAGGDPARQAALASLTALIVAGVFVLAWLLRLSVLVSFISESILTGFKAGAALVIASTQLPKLFGVEGGGEDFFHRIGHLVRQLPGTNLSTLAIGVAALAALAVGGKFLPGRPVALGVVVLALVAASLVPVEQQGVKVVGRLTPGLPDFLPVAASLGDLRVEEVRQLTRLAFACFLLAYIESVSSARAFALKHRYRWIRAGVPRPGGGQPPGGPLAGLPRRGRVVAERGQREGRRTHAAVAGFRIRRGRPGAPLLHRPLSKPTGGRSGRHRARRRGGPDRPQGVAVPVAREPNRFRRGRSGAGRRAAHGGPGRGHHRRPGLGGDAPLSSTRPHVAFLGRIPGTDRFSDVTRHPENEAIPGVLAFRVEGSLVYFNADHVLQTVLQRVDGEPELRRVVYDLSNTPYVDVAAALMSAPPRRTGRQGDRVPGRRGARRGPRPAAVRETRRVGGADQPPRLTGRGGGGRPAARGDRGRDESPNHG